MTSSVNHVLWRKKGFLKTVFLFILTVAIVLLIILTMFAGKNIIDLPKTAQKIFVSKNVSPQRCLMDNCFDFSSCPLTDGFHVFIYQPESLLMKDTVLTSLISALSENKYITQNPKEACVYVVLFGKTQTDKLSKEKMQHFLHSLSYWNHDGSNHVLISLMDSIQNADIFMNVDIGRALIAQPEFHRARYRQYYDIIIPPLTDIGIKDTWSELPPISPGRRKYLLSFWGEYILPNENETSSSSRKQYDAIVSSLRALEKDSLKSGETVKVDLTCSKSKREGLAAEWGICGQPKERGNILSKSTFTLLISPLDDDLVTTVSLQTRFWEALKYGAVPVILGSFHRYLPYSEILDWSKATLTLPLPRIKDLIFYLSSFGDSDIVQLRRSGRFFWETYFSSTQSILHTSLALLRFRLHIPALPAREEPAMSIFTVNVTAPSKQTEKHMEPVGPRFPSERFQRNFSRTLALRSFNEPGDPFSLFPFTPFAPLTPAEAKFWGEAYYVQTANGSDARHSRQFSTVLEGNIPQEQFTVVILTYKRMMSLLAALRRLKGLAFLNKIVVIWNDPDPPSSTILWPDIGVPLEVLKTKENNLNNRYMPYDTIETEAVLNLDDDVVLSHERIIFAFRVWRQERDRIVGLLSRYHWWDIKSQKWLYSVGAASDEISIVIPSAAFLNKYYFYLYTYIMPQAIRDYVKRRMNCEDIAMNYLVAHITRKPPIRVKAPWKRECPDCAHAISSSSGHLSKRHQCIHFFAKVYGYQPLLFTVYAVDSNPPVQ